MSRVRHGRFFRVSCILAILLSSGTLPGRADRDREMLRLRVATGQHITPLAAPGSSLEALHTDLRADDNADAANAVTSALSPDGSTLLILTSGFNYGFSREDGTPILYPVLDPLTGIPTGDMTSSAEWVFVYDVTGAVPVQKQKINLPVTYNGLVWDPSGTRFYVSGGAHDIVYAFKKVGAAFQLDPPAVVLKTGGQLDGTKAGPMMRAFGLAPIPVVAGLAVSPDGGVLYAANFENDSVSVIDTTTRQVLRREVFAAPGGHTARGEYPYWVAVRGGRGGEPDKVFVTSQRDAQVVVFDGQRPFRVVKVGSEPNRTVLSKDGSRLYVANGDGDSVSVIDTDRERVTATISMQRPGYPYKGSNPRWRWSASAACGSRAAFPPAGTRTR
jgi:YVTN family beta-propeller protein